MPLRPNVERNDSMRFSSTVRRGEHRAALGRVGDALLAQDVRRLTGDVVALEQQLPGGGRDEPRADAGHGGLAGAVGPDQRHRRAGADRERHAEQRPERPVAGVDVVEAQQVVRWPVGRRRPIGGGGGHSPLPR